jgi:hypothetical protein
VQLVYKIRSKSFRAYLVRKFMLKISKNVNKNESAFFDQFAFIFSKEVLKQAHGSKIKNFIRQIWTAFTTKIWFKI